MSGVANAYSTGAGAWAAGPIRQYGVMAEQLVALSPFPLRGRRVLDLGSGTGAASRPALAAGADVLATDMALGMLQTEQMSRPRCAVGDATALPLRAAQFDLVVAAFSLNHLDHPSLGVREVARVLRSEGCLLASTYEQSDDHPVKQCVECALQEVGWERPAWYQALRTAMSAWGTVDGAREVVVDGGMQVERVERRDVGFPDLAPHELVSWRLGMAQSAGFVATLPPQTRAGVERRALELLGPEPEPLTRRVLFIVARAR